GTNATVPYMPAACVEPIESLVVSATRVKVPCGLIPGASGGGLYSEHGGELLLVGIVSSVTTDLRSNGVVPLSSLYELLQHTEHYSHGFASQDVHKAGPAQRYS